MNANVLTGTEWAILVQSLKATWRQIGFDSLSEGDSLPRSTVVEAVMDADFLETLGHVMGVDEAQRRNMVKRFREGTKKQRDAILRDAFPFKTYSL